MKALDLDVHRNVDGAAVATYRTLHIGPAHGHIANVMALKNRGIWQSKAR